MKNDYEKNKDNFIEGIEEEFQDLASQLKDVDFSKRSNKSYIMNKVLKNIDNKGMFYNMKIKFLRARTAIVVGLLCVVTTATCVAATNSLKWTSTSYNNNSIKTFPSKDAVKSTVGFLPKYAESFDYGFKFSSFNYSENTLSDDNNAAIKVKEANFYYKKDGAQKNQILTMNATHIDEKFFINGGEAKNDVIEYNDIKIYYSSIKYKSVPEGYEKTEEDLKLINEGLLQIGYGSDKVEECKTQFVTWYEGGIAYLIMNKAYDDVNRDAMIEMAKTVINK